MRFTTFITLATISAGIVQCAPLPNETYDAQHGMVKKHPQLPASSESTPSVETTHTSKSTAKGHPSSKPHRAPNPEDESEDNETTDSPQSSDALVDDTTLELALGIPGVTGVTALLAYTGSKIKERINTGTKNVMVETNGEPNKVAENTNDIFEDEEPGQLPEANAAISKMQPDAASPRIKQLEGPQQQDQGKMPIIQDENLEEELLPAIPGAAKPATAAAKPDAPAKPAGWLKHKYGREMYVGNVEPTYEDAAPSRSPSHDQGGVAQSGGEKLEDELSSAGPGSAKLPTAAEKLTGESLPALMKKKPTRIPYRVGSDGKDIPSPRQPEPKQAQSPEVENLVASVWKPNYEYSAPSIIPPPRCAKRDLKCLQELEEPVPLNFDHSALADSVPTAETLADESNLFTEVDENLAAEGESLLKEGVNVVKSML